MSPDGKKTGFIPEQLYQATLDTIQEGISILDRDLTIVRVNKTAEERYRFASPLVGKKCYEVFRGLEQPCEPCYALEAIAGKKAGSHIKPLIQNGIQTGYLEVFYYPLIGESGTVSGVVEYARDITEQVEREQSENESRQRAERQRKALARLSADPDIAEGNIDSSVRTILKTAAEAVQTERVSLWLVSGDQSELRCMQLYELSKEAFRTCASLVTQEYPRYFEAIKKDSRIYAADALNDFRTSELKETYLEQIGITSLLDAGIFIEGHLAGVLCFEHVGATRQWHADDESFASTIASIAAQLIIQNERKQAREELKSSETKYRALIEQSLEMVYVHDQEGNILEANASAVNWTGYTYEELTSMKVFDLHAFDIGRDNIIRQWKNWVAGKDSVFLETSHKRKDGSIYSVEISTGKITIDEDEVILSQVRDVSEKRAAEEKFWQSEARSRALVDAMPDMMFRFSLDGTYLDAEIKDHTMLTDQGRRLYQDGQLIGRKIEDVLDPELAGSLLGELKKAATSGQLQVIEYSYPVEGQDRYFEARLVSNDEQEVTSIVRDITERKEAEEALKESEERYRDILATMEEAYYEADLAGNITFVNEASLRLFGNYTPEEAIGITYEKLYSDPNAAFKTFHRVFLTGQPEKGLVLEMIRKDGSTFYGEISITLMKDKQGYVTGFKGIGKEVTDRIEYEKQLEYLSMHDQLTGIYNRAYFETELARLEQSRHYPITIISCDLDGLKLVNDTMGHDIGDGMLVKCAQIIKSALRKSDVLARVGGDEFSGILPSTTKSVAEKIVRRIKQQVIEYNAENEELPLGISIGVATAEQPGQTDLKELFKRADDMMYRDKLYSSRSSRSRIVHSLLATLAERDYITEGHARRLEDLCRSVGEKVSLSMYQLADLALLAQVHDLGKVGIPDHILFKPGPLTEEEWEIMRGHPEKGYRIASSSPDLSSVAELILKHHEHWDGGGYPMGLKGKDIPVECRILAIVDAFDAMTNSRPYNQKKSASEAIKELKNCAGSQFDPELVKVFIEVLSEQNYC